MTPASIATLRKSLGLSQAEFALRYGLTRDAVRAWEGGQRQPTGGTLTLLRLIERDPDGMAALIAAL